MGKMDEGGQKLQTFSYKISTRHVVYNMITVVCCMIYMKVKTVNPRNSHPKKIFFYFFGIYRRQ